jgi:hypothetical protein
MIRLAVIFMSSAANRTQLIVSITSWTNDLCDATCIVQQHEHPWLRHQSYVFYRKARIEAATTLENGLRQGIFEPLPDMNAQTFLRIRNGVCTSPQTPRKIKRYFGC